jgi:hypothetical protein
MVFFVLVCIYEELVPREVLRSISDDAIDSFLEESCVWAWNSSHADSEKKRLLEESCSE